MYVSDGQPTAAAAAALSGSPPLDRNTQMEVDQEGGIQIDEIGTAGSLEQSPNGKKRKRVYTDEEIREWDRVVKRKLEEERDRVDSEEEKHDTSNRELYALFNDLQGVMADFGIVFAAPELVVVGGQSDGKCTFSIRFLVLAQVFLIAYFRVTSEFRRRFARISVQHC